MYAYKVLKRGFIDGALRDPGSKHDPYYSDKKIECSWLELITEKKKRGRKPKDPAPQADKVQGKVASQDVVFEE